MPREIPAPPLSQLRSLYVKEKLSIEEIAKKSQVSYTATRRWLKKSGLLRSVSEANFLRYQNINARQQTSNDMFKWWAKRKGETARLPSQLKLFNQCYVCGRLTNNKTFCSTFCAHSPKGREIIKTKVKITIDSLPPQILAQRIRKSARRPNDYEKILDAILQDIFPGQWKYVGDGQLIINRKNPDWVNINGKKQLIELWGEYWHKHHDPNALCTHYKEYGYSTIIVWASELMKPELLKQKLRIKLQT